MTIIVAGSSTPILATPQSSSSASTPLADAVTASQTQPPPDRSPAESSILEKKWLNRFTIIGGVIFAGIVGYFSGIMMLKDSISDNKTEISVVRKEVENMQRDIKRIESDVGKIPSMITDIAVTRSKLENIDTRAKK